MQGRLSPSEVEIMKAVWAEGAPTVKEVLELINRQRAEPVTRNTVLKQMQRLTEKGWLQPQEEKRPLRYEALVDQETASASMTEAFTQSVFDGSPLSLVRCLIEGGRLKPGEMESLRELIDASGSKKGGRRS